AILKAHPRTGFVWTGKEPHPAVTDRLRREGVAERSHFAGWIDVKLYARLFDVFVETFPLGGGTSAAYALAAGVPVLSYLTPYTTVGNLRHARRSQPAAAPTA